MRVSSKSFLAAGLVFAGCGAGYWAGGKEVWLVWLAGVGVFFLCRGIFKRMQGG